MKNTPLYVKDHTVHVHSQVVDVTETPTGPRGILHFELDAGLQVVNGSSATNLDFSVYAYAGPQDPDAVDAEVLRVQVERAAVQRLLDHVAAFHAAFFTATDDVLREAEAARKKVSETGDV